MVSVRFATKGVLVALVLFCLCGRVWASQTHREKNRGWEQSLEHKGITAGLSYIGDVFGDVSGGSRRGSGYLHMVSGSVHIDLARLMGVTGGVVYVSGFWTLGDNPSEFIGDAQGVDNIAAPNTAKIFNAQYRQSLFNRRLRLMLGLYDVNSEFQVSERSNLFLNASFGIGPTFSESGVNGPSVFPTTAPAVRIEGDPSSTLTFRVVAANGIAGDPADPYGTHVIFGGGAMLAAELEHHAPGSDDRKLALGSWVYTALTPGIEQGDFGRPVSRSQRSYGFYALGDYPVWQDASGKREVGIFGRIGHASPGANRIAWFVCGGVTLEGSLLFGEDDNIGVGFVTAFNGSGYKDAMDRLGAPVENAETTFEITGQFGVCRQVSVQPDIQYVINPNTDPAIGNAVATFLRLNVQL